MNIVLYALRRPITIMVAMAAMTLTFVLALTRIGVDIFPQMNLPVIYVAQTYGGMDPAQMEGMLTNYYEYHFLYNTGIHHVESKNIQGLALIKLYFHPGTDMSQALAETINYANRAKAFMPPGTVPPFIMRFDVGSVPVGKLVFSSKTRSISEIQDLALFKVRPMFASLPGVSAPPPFGGNQRTVVISADPNRLQALGLTVDEVIDAIAKGNAIIPSGNLSMGDKFPIVTVNSIAKNIQMMGDIQIRPRVFLSDIADIKDSADLPTGYALVNGGRSVYIEVTKRPDASTLSVVNAVKNALPKMQAQLPNDIEVGFEFDQSPYVTRAIMGLVTEGALGAVLVGLMVLLFLRDWRSVIVVVLNIPLSLMMALVGLWLCGQTINLMTLGGLALAIGMLVDEAAVEIENIHRQLQEGKPVVRAVKDGALETRVPRFLAMLCLLSVFMTSFFMQGAARALFVPLSLAVGFTMIASYLLSSTFVPILCVWLLKKAQHDDSQRDPWWQRGYEKLVHGAVRLRWLLLPAYLVVAMAVLFLGWWLLGMDIFPRVDAGQFRVKLKGPVGSHIKKTEEVVKEVLGLTEEIVGKDNIETSLAYVGTIPSTYPINAIFLWTGGSHEATLWVSLKPGCPLTTDELQERLRQEIAQRLLGVDYSFEPPDIISQVMSFGSNTPVEISINGPNLAESRAYAESVKSELAKIPSLRDLQYAQLLDYPTVDVDVDRKRAGVIGVTVADVGKALLAPTSSTRFMFPNFWPDPKTGIGYQVQLETPRAVLRPSTKMPNIQSIEDLKNVPVNSSNGKALLVRDVANIEPGTMPGEIDRYNMRREVTLIATVHGEDLGRAWSQISRALTAAGEPPRGAQVEVRGQIRTMREILTDLGIGLLLAVVVIFLLLAANFQSLRLALAAVSTAPAIFAGVVLILLFTGSTLNIQSFIGAIMAVGVGMANAILLLNFAENYRCAGADSAAAAVKGAVTRLRAIIMTSLAMLAGMMPMALGIGEFGQQNAPLGRAVVGGLIAATLATLLLLPCAFAVLQAGASRASASLDVEGFEEKGTN
jgi:multidrug efflux pump subunit AcrB